MPTKVRIESSLVIIESEVFLVNSALKLGNLAEANALLFSLLSDIIELPVNNQALLLLQRIGQIVHIYR